MSRITWLTDYRRETGCTLGDARRAWDCMYAKMAEDTKLRDAAALAALPAIIDVCKNGTREGDETREQMFARKAWAMADAFIAARETKEDD